MRLLKLALPSAILIGVLVTGGTFENSWAEAQGSSPITDNVPARDAATSAEDIALTNSCIEGGKEKIYCVCRTKIFKNEMTLRDYRGAVALQDSAAEARLTEMGYDDAEITHISNLAEELINDKKFRTRCDMAETFFAASSES